jgi:hypothetical protein
MVTSAAAVSIFIPPHNILINPHNSENRFYINRSSLINLPFCINQQLDQTMFVWNFAKKFGKWPSKAG